MISRKFYILSFVSLILLSGCKRQVTHKNLKYTEDQKVYVLPVKGIAQTNLEEAVLCKKYYKSIKDYDLAVKYAEQNLSLEKDLDSRANLILEIAELYMILENYNKANLYYKRFKELYPGSDKINYVMYKEIKSSKARELDPLHDQVITEETIKLSNEFLKNYPDDPNAAEVKDILRNSNLKILEYDLNIAKFYLNKYSYEKAVNDLVAAFGRIEDIANLDIVQLEDAVELKDIAKNIVKTPKEKLLSDLEKAVLIVENYLKKATESYKQNVKKSAWAFLR